MNNRKLGAPWGQTDQSLFSNTLHYWQDFVQNTRYLCPLQKMRNIWITHLKNKKNIKRFVYYFSFLLIPISNRRSYHQVIFNEGSKVSGYYQKQPVTWRVATFVQGTVVQGHLCPRDISPRRHLSKETFVQGVIMKYWWLFTLLFFILW